MHTKTLKKIAQFVFIPLLGYLFFGLIFPNKAYAAVDVTLSPDSGTISGSTTIDVNINTNGDTLNGIDVELSYSGDINYISGTGGDISECSSPSITEISGTINIICFVDPGTTYTGSGTLAQLTFNPTANGTASISVDNIDAGLDGGGTADVGSTGSGSYTTALSASLSLSPSTGSYAVGDDFDVQIMLDTAGQDVSAVDAIVNYDSSVLQVTDITPGSIFSSYPEQSSSASTIEISGLDASTTSPFNGSNGVFATIGFRVLDEGDTNLTFDFTTGSTLDSNVVEASSGQSNDILNSVTNASYSLLPEGTGSTDLPDAALFLSSKKVLAIFIGMLFTGGAIFLLNQQISTNFKMKEMAANHQKTIENKIKKIINNL